MKASTKKNKIIASVISIIFCTTTIGWSAPEMSLNVATLASSNYDGLHLENTNVQLFPEDIAKVTKSHRVEQQSLTVFHIQDAHTSLEAQKNIYLALNQLVKTQKVEAIFVEGAMGSLDPNIISLNPLEKNDLRTINKLKEYGVVGGVESFLLEPWKKNIPAFGVENENLYVQNLQDYRDVAHFKKNATRAMLDMKSKIISEASKVLNVELYNFFKPWSELNRNENNWTYGINFLLKEASQHLMIDFNEPRSQVPWPQLTRLVKIKKWSNQIDYAKVTEEKKALEAMLEKSNLRVALAFFKSFDSETNFKPTFINSIRESLEEVYKRNPQIEERLKEKSHLVKLIGLRILEEELDVQKLVEESDALAEQIFDVLVKKKAESKFLLLFRQSILIEKLLKLQLSYEEFAKLERIKNIVEFVTTYSLNEEQNKILLEALEKAKRFYLHAKQRDQAMFEKMSKKIHEEKMSSVVLITGGFHARGLENLMIESGYSFFQIAPHISQIENSETYEDIVTLRGHALLDRHTIDAPSILDTAVSQSLPQYAQMYARLVHLARQEVDNPRKREVGFQGERSELRAAESDWSAWELLQELSEENKELEGLWRFAERGKPDNLVEVLSNKIEKAISILNRLTVKISLTKLVGNENAFRKQFEQEEKKLKEFQKRIERYKAPTWLKVSTVSSLVSSMADLFFAQKVATYDESLTLHEKLFLLFSSLILFPTLVVAISLSAYYLVVKKQARTQKQKLVDDELVNIYKTKNKELLESFEILQQTIENLGDSYKGKIKFQPIVAVMEREINEIISLLALTPLEKNVFSAAEKIYGHAMTLIAMISPEMSANPERTPLFPRKELPKITGSLFNIRNQMHFIAPQLTEKTHRRSELREKKIDFEKWTRKKKGTKKFRTNNGEKFQIEYKNMGKKANISQEIHRIEIKKNEEVIGHLYFYYSDVTQQYTIRPTMSFHRDFVPDDPFYVDPEFVISYAGLEEALVYVLTGITEQKGRGKFISFISKDVFRRLDVGYDSSIGAFDSSKGNWSLYSKFQNLLPEVTQRPSFDQAAKERLFSELAEKYDSDFVTVGPYEIEDSNPDQIRIKVRVAPGDVDKAIEDLKKQFENFMTTFTQYKWAVDGKPKLTMYGEAAIFNQISMTLALRSELRVNQKAIDENIEEIKSGLGQVGYRFTEIRRLYEALGSEMMNSFYGKSPLKEADGILKAIERMKEYISAEEEWDEIFRLLTESIFKLRNQERFFGQMLDLQEFHESSSELLDHIAIQIDDLQDIASRILEITEAESSYFLRQSEVSKFEFSKDEKNRVVYGRIDNVQRVIVEKVTEDRNLKVLIYIPTESDVMLSDGTFNYDSESAFGIKLAENAIYRESATNLFMSRLAENFMLNVYQGEVILEDGNRMKVLYVLPKPVIYSMGAYGEDRSELRFIASDYEKVIAVARDITGKVISDKYRDQEGLFELLLDLVVPAKKPEVEIDQVALRIALEIERDQLADWIAIADGLNLRKVSSHSFFSITDLSPDIILATTPLLTEIFNAQSLITFGGESEKVSLLKNKLLNRSNFLDPRARAFVSRHFSFSNLDNVVGQVDQSVRKSKIKKVSFALALSDEEASELSKAQESLLTMISDLQKDYIVSTDVEELAKQARDFALLLDLLMSLAENLKDVPADEYAFEIRKFFLARGMDKIQINEDGSFNQPSRADIAEYISFLQTAKATVARSA